MDCCIGAACEIRNCNDWYNFPVKYDAYLVLCYAEILCPICPFEIEQAYLWLINKRSKEVFYVIYDPLSDGDGIAKCDIEAGKNGKSELILDGGLECADASDGDHDPSETLFATVTFKRLNLNIKPDPYCPECSTDCEEVRQATEDKVYRAAKPGKYIWWEIVGENQVYPFGDGPT